MCLGNITVDRQALFGVGSVPNFLVLYVIWKLWINETVQMASTGSVDENTDLLPAGDCHHDKYQNQKEEAAKQSNLEFVQIIRIGFVMFAMFVLAG